MEMHWTYTKEEFLCHRKESLEGGTHEGKHIRRRRKRGVGE
jgi:hypothetical protein